MRKKNAAYIVVGNGLHDGLGVERRIGGLKDPRANEHAVHAQLHHQRSVGGSRDTAGRKVDDGQAAEFGRLLDELVRSGDFLRESVELRAVHTLCVQQP